MDRKPLFVIKLMRKSNKNKTIVWLMMSFTTYNEHIPTTFEIQVRKNYDFEPT